MNMNMSALYPVTPVPSPNPSRRSKMMITTDFMKRDTDIEDDVEVMGNVLRERAIKGEQTLYNFVTFPYVFMNT
jgi:hypothetical protein